MQLEKLGREHYGKLILIGASVVLWITILVLFKTYGYEKTWQLWKVPTEMPPFLDFRLIPGSADSFLHGYEPTVKNPFDPRQRIFNYPFFWRLFFYSGITQDDTVWISVTMIVLFFISTFLFPKNLSIPGAIGMLTVLFSPASMLLYERGNVDLIVFVVCVLIVLAAMFSEYLAALLLVAGGIIKLFPILGVSVLLKLEKRKFWWLSVFCVLSIAAYMILTLNSVKASWNTTMRGDGTSYGTDVLVTRYKAALSKILLQWFTPQRTDLLLKYGPLVLALVLLLLVAVLILMNVHTLDVTNEQNLAAFRMGASIYVGTFLLGNNWDYRLAFLVLLVPQLVEWMRSANRIYRTFAWLSMFLVLASCWHLWIVNIPLESIFHSVADSQKFWIILDEMFNWTLFLTLAYLLFASTPDWLKNPLRNLLPAKI